jgi:hypothetical protein
MCGLTCGVECPRISVRDRSSLGLMTRQSSPDLRLEGSELSSAAAVDPTALAARVVAVRIGSGWTNVPDRSALAAAARY